MSDAHHEEIAKLEALYAEHPEGRVFTHLAEAYRKAERLERAHEVLTEGIGRHPDHSSAHVVLGRVLMDMGRNDEARTEFRRVLELDQQNLVALRSLGDIARGEGRTEDALEHYRELLDLEPSDADVRDIVESLAGAPAAAGPAETGEETPDDDGLPGLPELETSEPETLEPETPELETPEPETPEPETPELETEPETSELETEPETWAPETSEPKTSELETSELETSELGAGSPGDEWGIGDDVLEAEDHALEAEDDVWDAGDELDPDTGPAEVEAEDAVADAAADAAADALDAAGVEDADVMTETIAQVYARQGLYERAVEVYQELIRLRPEDEGLQRRLAEMQEQAAAEREEAGTDSPDGLDEAGIEVEETPEQELTPDTGAVAGLESVEFEGDVEADEVAPLEGLEADEPEAEASPWTHTAATDAEESDEEVDAPEAEATAPAVDESPWTDAVEPADPEADELEPDELEADELEADELEPDALEADEPSSPWVDEVDAAEPEAETPYAWAEAQEEPEDASPPIGGYLEGLLSWGAGVPAPTAPEPGAAPSSEADVDAFASAEDAAPDTPDADTPDADAPDTLDAPDAPDAPGSAEPAGPTESDPSAPGDAGGDDDDLEMFRSWLESLKQ